MLPIRHTVAFALAALVIAMPRAHAEPHYHVVHTVALGAPDRWDYVLFDPASRRVFAAHADHTEIVDGDSGAILGRVGPLDGAHGQAVAPELGRGFADSGRSGSVTIFDLRSLKSLATVKAGPDADALVYDPASRRVFVMNGDSGLITVIDAAAERPIATIDAGGALEFAAPDGRGALFVNLVDARAVARIDTRTARVTAKWPIPDCVSPHGMAYDAQTRRIFTSCVDGWLDVLDAENGRVVARLPIGKGSDSVAIDELRRLVFSANSDGTVTVIKIAHASHFEPQGVINTPKGARTMAVDSKSGRLYLLAATVLGSGPPHHPGGPPSLRFVPGSLNLMMLDP
jgi:YVTN family beta-propeller protein